MNEPWARSQAGSAEAALSGLGSAVQAAIPAAAGHDSSIPRSFFALFDVTVLVVAFAMTKGFAPWVQWLLLPDGPFRLSLPAWLALPESASPENFAALPNLSWVLIGHRAHDRIVHGASERLSPDGRSDTRAPGDEQRPVAVALA